MNVDTTGTKEGDSARTGRSRPRTREAAGASVSKLPDLRALALLFLRLGTLSFGGPAAHTAMMENEVVRRRGWMTREEFLDLLGAANLIPGPNSTEMAIHIGFRRGGWPGLVVAGVCIILPASLLTLLLAWAYVRFGKLPQAEGLLYGAKPVIIAVVLQALWGLTRTAVKSRYLAGVTVLAVAASFAGMNELIILAGAGAAAAAQRWLKHHKEGGPSAGTLSLIPGVPFMTAWGAAAVTPFTAIGLFLFFLKVGAVLYGSGLVLLAFIRADLVDRWHWLTEAQLLDAIAVGQITPGPVITTATFIGYILHGGYGALVATLGIFLPAFVFVAVSGPLVPWLRRSPAAGSFLDGVNAASLALMTAVTFYLTRGAVVDLPTGILAAVSAFLLLRFSVNSVWLVLAGGIVGIVVGWLH